jgi:hypothetical protein
MLLAKEFQPISVYREGFIQILRPAHSLFTGFGMAKIFWLPLQLQGMEKAGIIV